MDVDRSVPQPNERCRRCAAEVLAADRFCPACGAAVPWAEMVRVELTEEPPGPRRIGMRGKLALASLAVVGVLAVVPWLTPTGVCGGVTSGGCGPPWSQERSGERHDLSGTISVDGPGITGGPEGCRLPPPNDTLVLDATVAVVDDAGTTLALGAVLGSALLDDGTCNLSYLVPGVPPAEEYHLRGGIGRGPRGWIWPGWSGWAPRSTVSAAAPSASRTSPAGRGRTPTRRPATTSRTRVVHDRVLATRASLAPGRTTVGFR